MKPPNEKDGVPGFCLESELISKYTSRFRDACSADFPPAIFTIWFAILFLRLNDQRIRGLEADICHFERLQLVVFKLLVQSVEDFGRTELLDTPVVVFFDLIRVKRFSRQV